MRLNLYINSRLTCDTSYLLRSPTRMAGVTLKPFTGHVSNFPGLALGALVFLSMVYVRVYYTIDSQVCNNTQQPPTFRRI